MSLYIALLHHPVYNKRGDIVSTCITGFDLHDIARSSVTFGVKRYFVVNPLLAQREFAARIIDFWMDEQGQEFNWTRAEAFKLISIKADLDEVVEEMTRIEGKKPRIIATSARPHGTIGYEALKAEMKNNEKPYLILFGTGWGMTEELIGKADAVLPPILGENEYNHLSVRSATAIILDRLIGR